MPGMLLQIPNLYPCFNVCCPFKNLNQYHCNVHEKKVQVLELIPIDLFDKAKEIAIISLLVLYNINPMALAICDLPSPTNPKQ